MVIFKRLVAGVALTAALLGAAACQSAPEANQSERAPAAPPSTVAQITGPEALAMLQQVMTQLEQASTSPDGQPRAPSAEEFQALLQAQANEVLNQAKTKS